MDATVLFAIGTLSAWTGWIFLFRVALLALRLVMKPVGFDRAATIKGLGIAALVAAVGLGVGYTLSFNPGREVEGMLRLPLVWFSMPAYAWGATVCTALALVRLGQAFSQIDPAVRRAQSGAAAVWLVLAVVLFVLFRRLDPEWSILRGMVVLQPIQALVLALLAFAAMVMMALAAKTVGSRTKVKALATHLALIVGSFIFGLPFAWMLITSFKEDRDMASPTGLVWVPKVTVTDEYLDPENPTIRSEYQGQTVEGTIVTRNEDGSAVVDIVRPSVMRGMTFTAQPPLQEVPREVPVVTATHNGEAVEGRVIKDMEDGSKLVELMAPAARQGEKLTFAPGQTEPKRIVGLRTKNYPEALEFLPVETMRGLVYVRNTVILVVLNVLGTILSSAIVAYAFARLRFPGKSKLFVLLLSTMMLPAAVTLLPTFLIFRQLGWIDSLLPLWVPAFVGSAFNIFMLRQFFATIPGELEDAAKIDGCSYWKTFASVMLPQIKPALAVVAIWTFMGAWNNFMGPLVYINSPEKMPISYALQLFQGDRGSEPGLLMAASTMSMIPVLLLFFFAQKYFIEGVTLSGLGGR